MFEISSTSWDVSCWIGFNWVGWKQVHSAWGSGWEAVNNGKHQVEFMFPKLGVLDYVAPEGWGKGHVHLKESLRFWKRLLVSLTDFITSTDLCQYQLIPREYIAKGRRVQNTKEVLKGRLGSSLDYFLEADIHREREKPWRNAMGRQHNWAATFNSIKKEQRSQTWWHYYLK